MRRPLPLLGVLLCAGWLFVVGCAPRVGLNEAPATLRFRERTATESTLSDVARSELRFRELGTAWELDRADALTELHRQLVATPTTSGYFALAEACLLVGRDRVGSDPAGALPYFATALIAAHDLLFLDTQLSTWSRRHAIAVELYNSSLAEWMVAAKSQPEFPPPLQTLAGATVPLYVVEGTNRWDADYFAEFYAADHFQVRGIAHRHRLDGLGAALAGRHFPDEKRDPIERFYPSHGLHQPLTAVVALTSPDAQGRAAELHLLNPADTAEVEIGSKTIPLSADLTLPMAVCLANTNLEQQGNTGLFNVEAAESYAGVYLMTPYDPNKIPVLFVHGLWSSAQVWRNAMNDLYAVPEIRERYQFWSCMYPTGLPILAAGGKIRTMLADAISTIDPERFARDDAEMIVVGHSMGGVLTRSLTQTSGDRVWDTLFRVPFDSAEISADLSAEDREYVGKMFFFEPLPYVKRVVLICAPHRGSTMSDEFIGRFGSSLIELPDRLVRLGRKLRGENLENMQPDAKSVLAEVPTSIDVLSPSSPILQSLADLPVTDRVITHVILGSPDGGESDGVVPHASSRLADAVSERIVPHGHDAYDHPYTIRELERILHEHRRAESLSKETTEGSR